MSETKEQTQRVRFEMGPADLLAQVRRLVPSTDVELLELAKHIIRESGEAPLTLSDIAKVLRMKKSNVVKYLARHEVPYAFEKGVVGPGYSWWRSDIMAAKARREADTVRVSSDEKRRAAALRRRDRLRNPQPEVDPVVQAAARLGPAQQKVMLELLRHPIKSPQGAKRHALRRVREMGYAESMVDVTGDTLYVLTDEGRRVAAEIRL